MAAGRGIWWTGQYPREKVNYGIRCNNCHQVGHPKRFCPHPTKPEACRRCGEFGHKVDENGIAGCPKAVCLSVSFDLFCTFKRRCLIVIRS